MIKIISPYAYFAPEQVASSHLWDNIHADLAKAGIGCTVYVPKPTRGVESDVRKSTPKNEVLYEGLLTVQHFNLYGEGQNPFLRAVRYFLSTIIQLNKCLFSAESKNVDAIYIVSTPPILGLVGALVNKYRGIPFIYNLQDIFPDSLVGTGLANRGGLLWKIGRKVENFTYRHADKIIVISEDFKTNIMAKGVPESKIEVIYNWIDENAVMPVAKENNPLFEEFGIDRNKFNVVYAGNLGNAQNIEVIIEAAEKLSDEHGVHFLIFGTGGLKDQFAQRVANLDLNNVSFFPLQPIERVALVYGLGDICVVSCKPGLGGAAMPSKTMSILSAGRPVLASFDEGELTYILRENNCGVSVPAGDVEAFATAVRDLSSDHESCAAMGQAGRDLILRRFTREVGTTRYVEVIKSVVNEKF